MLCCSLLVIVWFPLIGCDVTESSGLSRVPEYLLVVFQYNDYLMNKEEKKNKMWSSFCVMCVAQKRKTSDIRQEN